MQKLMRAALLILAHSARALPTTFVVSTTDDQPQPVPTTTSSIDIPNLNIMHDSGFQCTGSEDTTKVVLNSSDLVLGNRPGDCVHGTKVRVGLRFLNMHGTAHKVGAAHVAFSLKLPEVHSGKPADVHVRITGVNEAPDQWPRTIVGQLTETHSKVIWDIPVLREELDKTEVVTPDLSPILNEMFTSNPLLKEVTLLFDHGAGLGSRTFYGTHLDGAISGKELKPRLVYQTSALDPIPSPSPEPEPDCTNGSSESLLGAYAQCAGKEYVGPSCCRPGWECVRSDDWYSQCRPAPSDCESGNNFWSQCAGEQFQGDSCCPTGSSCTHQSVHFSQCVPEIH